MEDTTDAIGETSVINNDPQQVNNVIVSTMTTVTGNGTNVTTQMTSQTVEDLEQDPKWEMTTLEKASYDCSDMYIDTLPEQQVKQSIEMVVNGDSVQEPATQQSLSEPLNQNNDKAQREESIQFGSAEIEVEPQPALSVNADVELHPMVNVEPETHEQQLIKEEETQSNEPVMTPADIVNLMEADSKQQETDHSGTKDSNGDHENTNFSARMNDGDGHDHVPETRENHRGVANFNSLNLSQSTVDPHFATDSIEDLGAGQQFTRILESSDDVTDQAKEVGNMREEIKPNTEMLTNVIQSNIQEKQPEEVQNTSKSETNKLASHEEPKQLPDLNTEQETGDSPSTHDNIDIVLKPNEQDKPPEDVCSITQPEPTQIDPLDEKEDSEDSLGDIKAEISSFVDQDMSCYSKIVAEEDKNEPMQEVKEKQVVEDLEKEAKQVVGSEMPGCGETEVSAVERKVETRRTSRRVKVAPKVDQKIDKPAPRKEKRCESEEAQVMEESIDTSQNLVSNSDETVETTVPTKANQGENVETTEPERVVRTMRSRTSKRFVKEESPKVKIERKPTKRSQETEDDLEESNEPPIKLTSANSRLASSRMTISTSTPSTRIEQQANFNYDDESRPKKYRCEQCNYETDRLNNIVYHKKTTDACDYLKRRFEAQVDSWKQKLQSPKSNNKRFSR